MIISKQLTDEEAFNKLEELLCLLHVEGPVNSEILERISYFKKFHSELFSVHEEKIISMLGLFYKIKEPTNIYTFLLSGFGMQHKQDYGEYLTPIQASIRRAMDSKQIISISAPTSAGKSFSIRDYIYEQDGDAVVIVPSRALIAEYTNTMKRKFNEDKNVMISSFVDDVFKKRNLRRIFIITPERARDLFASNIKLNIKLFFFDEAQISDEKERGILFDVLVRRIKKDFRNAKIVFAHPFIENPEAQFIKHKINFADGFCHSYTHGTVGKICIFQHSSNKDFYYFSPFLEKGHVIKNCIKFEGKFSDFAFDESHSVLVYVSKASIYNGKFLTHFRKYIKKFTDVKDEKACLLIQTIEQLLGANNEDHKSNLVSLLRKGVVIHHGSVPLEVRFLMEDFIRHGFARICFATSTLAQGINMPFDIVWLENNRFLGDSEAERSLAFKNLIGRAGRLTDTNNFDFGYVFTKNPKLLSQRINTKIYLKEESVIDTPLEESNQDSAELIESLKNNTFDEDKQIPLTKIERFSKEESIKNCKIILDILYEDGKSIKDNLYGANNKENRSILIRRFQSLYETSINRVLYPGENAVFEQAIRMFLYVIQGRSFREIIGLRYSYISRKDENQEGKARFSQPAEKLPKSTLRKEYPIFKNTMAKDVSYDTIVFDTYDYLDQVISFSLSDSFIAAFKVYNDVTGDIRVDKIIELLQYGTNNPVYTLLIRYGFPPENIAEISEYIHSISEYDIIFKPEISEAPQYILKLVGWYRP